MKPANRQKKGIFTEVRFFETHRCTELFFLYYFRYTARPYGDQSALLQDLNRQCGYEKTIEFFKKSKGLHSYFEKNGGTLDSAVRNANRSVEERNDGNRDYTYSELGQMIEVLKELQ